MRDGPRAGACIAASGGLSAERGHLVSTPTTADGRFGREAIQVITRSLGGAYNELERLRYEIEQFDDAAHDVTEEQRLDTETVGRLFLALDWFVLRGEGVASESREALEMLPRTSKLSEVPQDV